MLTCSEYVAQIHRFKPVFSLGGSSVTIAIKDTSMSCAEKPVNACGTGAQMMYGKHVAYLCQHICPFPTRKARNCFSFFINSYVVNWTMSIHYTAYTQYIPCDCLQAPRKLWERANWGPKKGLLWFGAVWRGVVMLMLMGQMPDTWKAATNKEITTMVSQHLQQQQRPHQPQRM